MSEMPSSPHTPQHSRQSSTIDSAQGSPQARRYSKSSVLEPCSLNHQDPLDLHILRSGSAATGSGMGNLADELADAFSESGEDEEEGDEDEDAEGGGLILEREDAATRDISRGKPILNESRVVEESRSCTVEAAAPRCTRDHEKDATLAIPSPQKRGHQRRGSEYDGSEYGSESDLDSTGMPPALIAKIDGIESLARRGTGSYGGPTDDVVLRVTHGLRDLGSQSTVEGSASR